MEKNTNTVKAILFEGRHPHPETDGLSPVFSGNINPMDFGELDKQAEAFFSANEADEYVIYVTGLTAATVAVIKAAVAHQVTLTLMHYDSSNGDYKPQRVVTTILEEQGSGDWGVTVPVALY